MEKIIHCENNFASIGSFLKDNPIFLNVILKYGKTSFNEEIKPYDADGTFSLEFISLVGDIFGDNDQFQALLISIRENFLYNPRFFISLQKTYTLEQLIDILFYFRHIALESQGGEKVVEDIFSDKLLNIISSAQQRQVGQFGDEYSMISKGIRFDSLPINNYGEICAIIDSNNGRNTVIDINTETIYVLDRLGMILNEGSHAKQKSSHTQNNSLTDISDRASLIKKIKLIIDIIAFNNAGRTGELDAEAALFENHLYTQFTQEDRIGFEGGLAESNYEVGKFIQLLQELQKQLETKLRTIPVGDLQSQENDGSTNSKIVRLELSK